MAALYATFPDLNVASGDSITICVALEHCHWHGRGTRTPERGTGPHPKGP